MSEALALALLALTVVRPRRVPEAAVALACAALLLATGAVTAGEVRAQARDLGPTLGFLAAVLVIGALAEREGLFDAAGRLLAVRSRGEPPRLLGLVVALAAGVTAVLSLDATVVLLTPVVLATAGAVGVRARPHLYACGHLSNSASILLPVSNLTNLLALRAADVSFPRFAALMALPWVAVVSVEWAAVRRLFPGDLRGAGAPPAGSARMSAGARYAAGMIVLTLLGFLAGELLGADPAAVAGAGAVALAVPALLTRRTSPGDLVRSAAPSFLVFVLALAVIVRAAADNGLGDAVAGSCPTGRPWRPCSASRSWRRCWRTSSTTCRRPCCCCPCWRRTARGPCSRRSSG